MWSLCWLIVIGLYEQFSCGGTVCCFVQQMNDGEQNNILQQCNGIFRMKENHMEELVVD